MEKKERRRVLIHRQKSYLPAGVVTLVAVVAMMGAYQYEKRAEKQEQQEQDRQAEMLQEELVSFAPPQVCETPIDEVQETVENDPYKTLTFTVRGRLSDLRKLKQFLVSGPYEIV